MASAPPDLPGSTVESPIDRALALALADELDTSLRWATALVQSEPASPIALLITSRLLADLDRHEIAAGGLDVCVSRAIDAGNLPLAVAACRDLRALGADDSLRLDDIAVAFAADSPRLVSKGATPPELPGHTREGFQPLPAALSGEALLAQAQEALQAARQLLDDDRAAQSTPSRVPAEPLFSALDRDALRAMIGIFDTTSVSSGAVLIEQGTRGAEAYIVARGELEVRRKATGDDEESSGILLARLGTGALFGEMALLSRSTRAASVVACRPSIILVARKDALDAVAARQPRVGTELADYCRRRMVENLVRTSTILSAVKPNERPALVERFVTRTFEEGERLIEQGQESDGLHLVASGEVAVMVRDGDESTEIAKLGVGEVVGEVALVLRRPSNADVIADQPTVTLHLPRDRFLDLIKQHPAILGKLYELAIRRDEETSSIVAQEATDANDFVLI